MPRGSVKKILSEVRPIDRLKQVKVLPQEFVYCLKTNRLRERKTGHFVSRGRMSMSVGTVFFSKKDGRLVYGTVKRNEVNTSVRKSIHGVSPLGLAKKEAKRERWNKQQQRKEARKQQQLVSLMKKGHSIEAGKLTKNILSIKRLECEKRTF